MKKVFLTAVIAISVLQCFSLHAQDWIVLKSGEEVNVKKTEVSDSQVNNKKADDQDEPLLVINKTDVFMPKYANGDKVMMKAPEKSLAEMSNRAWRYLTDF